jgi:NADPH-dependent 2,4-dienoyl-CoA reductase/sulfur reductase-like enzyme
MQTTNPGTSMRKISLTILSVALLTVAGWAVQPAMAQGFVPGYTLTAPKGTAPGANAKGIKDQGVKGCGSCGLTGGRVKRTDGGRPAAKASDWVITMPTKNQLRTAAKQKSKFKAGADLEGKLR